MTNFTTKALAPIRRMLSASAIVLMTLLAGCASQDTAAQDSSSPAVSTESQELARCSTNCDCPYGRYCSGGQCRDDFGPYPQCYCAARDCGAGMACVGGFCQAGTSCSSNCDCAYGDVCVNGRCQDDFGPFPECYCARRDCGRGQICSNGRCSGGLPLP